MNQLDDLLWASESLENHLWAINLSVPFLYLLAPSIYLYVRFLVKPQIRQTFLRINIHLIGFWISIAICIPYYLLNPDIKMDWIFETKDGLTPLLFKVYLPDLLAIVFVPFSLLYFYFVFKILAEHLNGIKAYFSNIEDKQLSWLRWSIMVLSLVLVVTLIQLFIPIKIEENELMTVIFVVFEYFWILTFGMLALQQTPMSVEKQFIKYRKSKISDEGVRLRMLWN